MAADDASSSSSRRSSSVSDPAGGGGGGGSAGDNNDDDDPRFDDEDDDRGGGGGGGGGAHHDAHDLLADPGAEGYTPLNDDAMHMHGGLIAFHDGHGGGGPINGLSAAFYFAPPPGDDDDDAEGDGFGGDDGGDDGGGGRGPQLRLLPTNDGGGDGDVDDADAADDRHESLASDALRRLDEEYAATVGAGAGGGGEAPAASADADEAGGDGAAPDAVPGHAPLGGGGGPVASADDGDGNGDGGDRGVGIATPAEPESMPTAATEVEVEAAQPQPPPAATAADADRITSAVRAIRMKSPRLAAGLDAGWGSSSVARQLRSPPTPTAFGQREDPEQQQREDPEQQHPIIPPAPLAAFRPTNASARAVGASANLSRSATLAEAVARLFSSSSPTGPSPRRRCQRCRVGRVFRIHVIGADGVECQSDGAVRNALGPFVRWMEASLPPLPTTASTTTEEEEAAAAVAGADDASGDADASSSSSAAAAASPLAALADVEEIEFLLVGPNVPQSAERRGPVNLLPKSKDGDGVGRHRRRLGGASATCRTGLYHDLLRHGEKEGVAIPPPPRGSPEDGDPSPDHHPDLIIAFNPGLWGYDDWTPTLRALGSHGVAVAGGMPCVFTAYTVEEALDDAGAIEDALGVGDWATTAGAGANSGAEGGAPDGDGDGDADGSSRAGEEAGKETEGGVAAGGAPAAVRLWGPEANPFGSRRPRETRTAPVGRTYRENGAWQSWLLGGGGGGGVEGGEGTTRREKMISS